MKKEVEVVAEGGPLERTTKTTLRKKAEYPERGDAFPPQDNQEHLLQEAVKRVERKRASLLPTKAENLEVTIEELVIGGRSLSRQHVWFTVPFDPNFAGARIWVKGYGTDNTLGDTDPLLAAQNTLPFMLVAHVEKSPATFVLEASDEQVVIGVETINQEGIGSGLAEMPTVTVQLWPQTP